MAVTITVDELVAALRLGSTVEERAEASRLLTVATAAVTRHLGDAFTTTPDAVVNEFVVRWCGYAFDMPLAARGAGFADVARNSGALAIILPWKIHRAGSTGEADHA